MKNSFSKLFAKIKEESSAAFPVALFPALLIGVSNVFAIVSQANVVGIIAQDALVLIALIAAILSQRGQPVEVMALREFGRATGTQTRVRLNPSNSHKKQKSKRA